MEHGNFSSLYSNDNKIEFVVDGFNKDAKTTEKFDKVKKIIFLTFAYLILIFLAFIMMIPFYWMLITSLKSEVVNGKYVGLSNDFFIPFNEIAWNNYAIIFDPSRFDFFNYLINTFIVLIISTIGTLFVTIFAAFAFTRLQFKGRGATFYIYLITMMIPSELFVASNFITVYRYGLLNDRWGTYFAIMLPFIVNVFYIYLLRENFKQIPEELYLASKVDGKSDWQYLWKVMVPIASPTLITITILKVISTWNAYAWPKTVTVANPEYTLITVGIRDIANFDSNIGGFLFTLQSLQMAATVIITIPLILLFIFFRKYIMSGTSRTGIKG